MKDKYTSRWNQKTIRDWSRETFGPVSTDRIARRMMKEVQELIDLFSEVGPISLDELSAEKRLALQMECADIAIFLDQIVEDLGADLNMAKSFKMQINAERRWAWNEAKRETRHVTEFSEEGSGLTMRLDRWYVLDEGGQCYHSKGFVTAQQALSSVALSAGTSCGVLTWNPATDDWRSTDGSPAWFQANVLFGRDVYDYQVKTNRGIL